MQGPRPSACPHLPSLHNLGRTACCSGCILLEGARGLAGHACRLALVHFLEGVASSWFYLNTQAVLGLPKSQGSSDLDQASCL